MQKGSIILALIGIIFTIVGVCVDEWLVYDPIKSGKGTASLEITPLTYIVNIHGIK